MRNRSNPDNSNDISLANRKCQWSTAVEDFGLAEKWKFGFVWIADAPTDTKVLTFDVQSAGVCIRTNLVECFVCLFQVLVEYGKPVLGGRKCNRDGMWVPSKWDRFVRVFASYSC